MLRSVGAVAAGFVTMSVLVMVFLAAWVQLRIPGGMAGMRRRMKEGGAMPVPSSGYVAYNLGTGLLAAVGGGWVTQQVATGAYATHLIALAALVAVMGAASALGKQSAPQPGWYKYVIPVVGVAGVALSALLGLGKG